MTALFPPPHPLCPLCGRESPQRWAPCSSCIQEMRPPPGPGCPLCGRDLAGSDKPCPECREKESFIEEMAALGPYAGTLKEWLMLFKFEGCRQAGHALAWELHSVLSRRWPLCPLVPVPPRRGKIFKEGWDQIADLSRILRLRGVPVHSLLLRDDRTPQKNLGRQERLSRKNSLFRLHPRGKGRVPRELVLLDDVRTTGATLEACAAILREEGARHIKALTVAAV